MEHVTSELESIDREYQIHSLHHRVDVDQQIIISSGHGIFVQSLDGRDYIDGLSGLWNVAAGHGRHDLADAAAQQMRKLAYFSGYAGSTTIPSIELAERLIHLAPKMKSVFFTSGGAEANESAFKTARYYWKVQGMGTKTKIISRYYGYHGVTLQAMSATGIPAYWKMFEPRVPGFLHIKTCYPYRSAAIDGQSAGELAARELEEMIEREGAETVAAFIGEPIHGAGGVIYPTDDYWPRVREICTRHNILLIADEIITAFGRTGRWFGLQNWDVTADIITFGKGVTSGYVPLGGAIVSAPIRNAIEDADPGSRWMHGYTNSGQPTCCAVALKNIQILEDEGLLENSRKMGDLLLQRLQETFGNHPHVGDIRGGKGLLTAVEFVEDRIEKRNFAAEFNMTSRLQVEMKKRGLLTRTRPVVGEHPAAGDQVLLAPPLIINEEEVYKMVAILADAVKAVLGG